MTVDEPIIRVSFDLIGAGIILLGLLFVVAALVFFTSWYWRRRLMRPPSIAEDTVVGERLTLLLDSLPEGILLANHHGRVLWCNPEASRMLHLNDTSSPLELKLIPIVKRVAESRQMELQEFQLTSEIKLQIKTLPLASSKSGQEDVICLVTDVSEQRHQEAFYRHFIHNISHELLTPLAAIAGHVANIHETSDEEAENRNISLTIIEREVKRLTALTSNLLLLSRLESEAPLHMEITNVAVVAEQAVAGLVDLAQEKGIEISTQSPSRLPHLYADRDRLKQIFINLVDNGIKHCPAGTAVQVRLHAEEGSIVAEIADNGLGIPPEDLPHIFEKLYRVQKEGTRATEGSGLGLSIVKRIVELHGGKITVESTWGEGTSFYVQLPIGQHRLP